MPDQQRINLSELRLLPVTPVRLAGRSEWLRSTGHAYVTVPADQLLALIEAVEAANEFRSHDRSEVGQDDPDGAVWERRLHRLYRELDDHLNRFDFGDTP